MLERGIALFIDYGFPRAEYYHPQRRGGTLMCHYRPRAHGDPFFLPGLQDITAHVDFTATAEAAHGAGADVLGYATQAQFLINCGLTEVVGRVSPDDMRRYAPLAGAANTLTSPRRWASSSKVLAFGRVG
jgi:SAM-dependent MidA family methyltransferase